MDRDEKTRYELQIEAEELSEVLRRLDAVRGMINESWAGDASKAFQEKLKTVIAEGEDVKDMLKRV